MKTVFCLVLLSPLAFAGRPLGADLLFSLESTAPLATTEEDPSLAFLRPNEIHTENQLEILKTAPAGALITVGTDRGDFTASLAPQINKIVKVDRSANVVRYNRIQRALMSVSRDVRHFRQLRSTGQFSDWAKTSPHRWQSDLSRSNFEWWRSLIAQKRIDLDRRDRRSDFRHDFLDQPDLFGRLAELIQADRTRILQTDLRELDAFEEILKRLKSEGVEIALIDLSNTWWPSYLGVQGVAKLLERAKPYTQPDTVWMFSYMYQGRFTNYFSFTRDEFKRQENLFKRLSLLVNTSYSLVLDHLPPVQGPNPDLTAWVPDENVTTLPSGCQHLLLGQEVEHVRRRLKIGQWKLP